jgi:hypothetical protein
MSPIDQFDMCALGEAIVSGRDEQNSHGKRPSGKSALW